jgi:hypothetical protein
MRDKPVWWCDYTIRLDPNGDITVIGDTETELLDKGLFQKDDIFIVNSEGVLVKSEPLMTVMKDAYKKWV